MSPNNHRITRRVIKCGKDSRRFLRIRANSTISYMVPFRGFPRYGWPMDIKKAQFRIEHLSGHSAVLITTIVWHCKYREIFWNIKGFGAKFGEKVLSLRKIQDYEWRGTHQTFGATYGQSRKKAFHTKCGDNHTQHNRALIGYQRNTDIIVTIKPNTPTTVLTISITSSSFSFRSCLRPRFCFSLCWEKKLLK